MNNINSIDLDKIVKSGLTLEQYFILHCIHYNVNDYLIEYEKKNKIDSSVYESLHKLGYINMNLTQDNGYHGLLSLTPAVKALLDTTALGEHNFEGFRKCYPSKVKFGLKVRPLQGNLARCKKLYDKLLLETTHDILCKCAKTYCNEQVKNDGGLYIQQLQRWLHEKMYLTYLDEIDKNVETHKIDHIKNLDAI